MERIKVVQGLNTWRKVRRKPPTTLSGLHLPEGAAREGRSYWYMEEDIDEMGLKKGDQILLCPEVWLYKVNSEDKDCHQFMVKEEHILAKVEVDEQHIQTI